MKSKGTLAVCSRIVHSEPDPDHVITYVELYPIWYPLNSRISPVDCNAITDPEPTEITFAPESDMQEISTVSVILLVAAEYHEFASTPVVDIIFFIDSRLCNFGTSRHAVPS